MNYTNGKIYTIKNKNDISLIYVGSTIQPLEQRFKNHKQDCKNQTKYPNHKLYNIVNNDWDDWYIELYELYPCNSKEELLKYEGKIIREIGTLNINIAGRSDKEYYLDNKEQKKEYQKKYRSDNKNKILEQQKNYRLKKKNELLSKTSLP